MFAAHNREELQSENMGKAYSEEMAQLPNAIRWAADQDVDLLRHAVKLYSGRGLLAVGSGGSFTAAAFASELHLRTFGCPSQAITPLETFQIPAASSSMAVGLLLSAEGKNPDILAAARQLQFRGCSSIGLTLRQDSPLVRFCDETGAAALAAYEMPWQKDGYLATNSLIAALVLIWRAYVDEAQARAGIAALLAWYESFPAQLELRARALSPSGRALILHGSEGRIGAIDLESKLTEGALAFGQICNFRQFAHGRHLQLHVADEPITVVSFSVENDPLFHATRRLLPETAGQMLDVTLPRIGFAGSEIAAVLAAFLITQVWAGSDRDPGRPEVPQFGRDIHFLDVSRLVNEPLPPAPALLRKRKPSDTADITVGHGRRYVVRLAASRLKALVCDFDGTFCDTVKRFEGLDAQVVPELARLARGGVHLAFATGRGAKLAKVLRDKLPSDIWPRVTVGCYSGSHVFALDDDRACTPPADARLGELARWLVVERVLPDETAPDPDAGQLGLRGISGAGKLHLMAAIREWIAQQGHEGWRVFCSAHSVDVLTEHAGKLLVVDHVCARFGLDPATQLLRIGDAGDFGGNDYELLSDGLSLSVDAVPPNVEHCWNLLPRTLSGVRGTEHYLRALVVEAGEARFHEEFIAQTDVVLREGLGLA